MTLVRLVIEAAGPLTTIQDGGRPGYMRFGVPRSGPVDRLAFAAVNAALANPPGSNVIEISGGGISIRGGEAPVAFALAGGDFTATIDGVAIGGWVTAVLPPGGRLTVRDGAAGNWACLAFAGRMVASQWLGSAATHALAGLGGGRVAAGQAIEIDAATPRLPGTASLPPPPVGGGDIRVVIGPQERFFAAEGLAALAAGPWRIGAAFDRMGVVLDGPPLLPTSLAMLSEPLVRGTLQVNGSGTATVLLADHQATGGYPRIATLISADVDRVAQLRPGSALRFVAVSVDEAIAAARRQQADVADWLAGVAHPATLEQRLFASNLIDGVADARSPL